MKASAWYTIFALAVIAVTVAVPIERDEPPNTDSVGQHLARAGLWVMGIATALGLTIGSVTYGANWLHRYQVMQAEHQSNVTAWEASQERKDKEYEKQMEALDILLEVTRNYTDNIGKERSEFDPFGIADRLENEVEDAEVIGLESE